jgi:MFS family permease
MTLVAALGGFLFGFDTIVINGAEQDIQRLWGLTGTMHGWVVSSALWGTVAGALAGGWISDRFGRKPTLCAIGALYFVSALWSALASGPWMLMAARLIGGIGVGVSTIAAPVYIAEISPPESRGKMTAAFQFNIVFGVLAALTSNLLLKDLGGNAWRYMLGAECIPAALFMGLTPVIAESPRYLAMKVSGGSKSDSAALFWSRANLGPILLAFLVAFFNQMSGCNAINYFAPRIFGMAGLGRDSQFLSSFGLGILNFASTFAGMWLIDRLGRKTLLLIGGIGYIVSLFAAAAFFAVGNGPFAAATIFLFIASHAVGQGTVIWVLISESFPQRFRAQGQALGASTHWVFAALVALLFPIAAERFTPASIFGFFGIMMVLHLFWVIFIVRETKGRSLEDIA